MRTTHLQAYSYGAHEANTASTSPHLQSSGDYCVYNPTGARLMIPHSARSDDDTHMRIFEYPEAPDSPPELVCVIFSW